MHQLSILDWAVLGIYLSLVLFNGIRASRKVKGLSDYSIASKSYPAIIVFATLSAAYIGGGFTIGLAEKTFSLGLFSVIALWGFSTKEILIAKYIAPRMQRFENAMSIGEIMGKLYGKGARLFTGFAGMLVCAGIAGAQFAAFGTIVGLLLDIPPIIGVLGGAVIVMFYSTLGGMRSVVANDTMHFIVLAISLPIVCFLGLHAVGGISHLMETLPPESLTLDTTKLSWFALSMLFLSFFFGETLVPPYVQRLLIGRTLEQTAKGTLWSGLMSIPFFLMVGVIGLVALALSPDLQPTIALPYVIKTVMPIGLKGLAIAGMLAVVMSSADAFLNSAAVLGVHDVLRSLRKKSLTSKQELLYTRLATLIIGGIGLLFALISASALDILLIAYNFWTPFIIVPLVAGILGFYATARTFWISSTIGIGTVIIISALLDTSPHFDATIAGIAANLAAFILCSLWTKNTVVPPLETIPVKAE